MKKILCFGDSNTWGYDPAKKDRFPDDVRWTGVLRAELGEGYFVIEEGLNGRTTVWDDPIEEHKNGKTYLYPCLETHRPFDLIVLMLGTNDLKARFSVTPTDIANSNRRLIEIIQASIAGRNGNPPQILLMCPPPVAENIADSWLGGMFSGSVEKSKHLAPEYQRVAEETGVQFLNAGEIIVSSLADAIHFDQPEHTKLGKAVAAKIKSILD